MRHHFINEPKLEFGQGMHVCPKSGIALYDVFDSTYKVRKSNIALGVVTAADNAELMVAWLEQCSKRIPGKAKSKQPNLFQPFCGFNEETGFRANFLYDESVFRRIKNSDLNKLLKIKSRKQQISEAVELYYSHVKFLAQNRNVDVVVCVIPKKLYDKIAKQVDTVVEENLDAVIEDDELELDFRRALKAKTMHLSVPIQLIRESSLKSTSANQDDATKAWNFCTAVYYKANQTIPWRIPKNVNRPLTCFVGIGFYRSRDRKILNTSLAQIFDELGNGVILRGTPVDIGKDDRVPYLSEKQAAEILSSALGEYRIAMDTFPGRLVIHKSSKFRPQEVEGFRSAAEQLHISSIDFVTILDTKLRFFRDGFYPPLRGTHIALTEENHLLYTRGSVPYYKTYPGQYIPQPIEVRLHECDESAELICEEILALTKMNWNNTQFDGKYPITLSCARKVGQIMKYLPPDEKPQIKYSFYM